MNDLPEVLAVSPPDTPRVDVWREPVSLPPPVDAPVVAYWTWHENGDPTDVRSQVGIARLHAVNSAGQFHYNGQHWQSLDPDGSWLLAGLPKAWTDVPMHLLKDLVQPLRKGPEMSPVWRKPT